MEFFYDQFKNEEIFSGEKRFYLTRVEYGTYRGLPQYCVEFKYSSLNLYGASVFDDYRSGNNVPLSYRINTIDVKQRKNESFETRTTYKLVSDLKDKSVTFYLNKIQKIDKDKKVLDTVLEFQFFTPPEKSEWTEVPEFKELLLHNRGILYSANSSIVDYNLDGLFDLEDMRDHTVYVRNKDGFTAIKTEKSPNAIKMCWNDLFPFPRRLVRLAGSKEEINVVQADGDFIYVCKRNGELVKKLILGTGDWSFERNIRLADLDNDGRPDVIRFWNERYEIYKNTSTANDISFEKVSSGSLKNLMNKKPLMIYDINGDGISDLVSYHSGGVIVWYGKTNFSFESVSKVIPLYGYVNDNDSLKYAQCPLKT